jgi:thymidylate synthase (FAD)
MKISNIKVELLDSMGSDLEVVNAARVSFKKQSSFEYDKDDPFNLYLNNKDINLIKYLANNNHHTPFGHCFLSFRIKAPIFIARQLAKHQIGLCWNEVSRRYVDDEPEFYLPQSWRYRGENIKQGSSDFIINEEIFCSDKISKDLCQNALNTYSYLIKIGVCPEQARMILPQNMMTEWIWSGSLLAFLRVCKLRLDPHTQKETTLVAKEIIKYIKEHFPESWNAYNNNANI